MGVETVVDEVEYKKRIQQPYALFNLVLSEDIRYRVESTPVSLTAAKIGGYDGGWYKYRLPKMPMGILKSLYCFFSDVAEKFKTEVLVRVYYDPSAEKYVLEVPEQKTAPGLVVTDQGLIPQYWPVMDIHSHCYYPAFFSETDNKDEKGNRIYGVIGSLDKRPQLLLRAGTGGCYVKISDVGKIFDENVSPSEDWYGIMKSQMKEKIHPIDSF